MYGLYNVLMVIVDTCLYRLTLMSCVFGLCSKTVSVLEDKTLNSLQQGLNLSKHMLSFACA